MLEELLTFIGDYEEDKVVFIGSMDECKKTFNHCGLNRGRFTICSIPFTDDTHKNPLFVKYFLEGGF